MIYSVCYTTYNMQHPRWRVALTCGKTCSKTHFVSVCLESMTLLNIILSILFATLIGGSVCVAEENASKQKVPFKQQKYYHTPLLLKDNQISKLSDLSNITHINEVLDNICVVRVVGTQEHQEVKNYIKKSMRDLGWTIESDSFTDRTPIFGVLRFENIIAKLNPNATRYLALACHYDSKYSREGSFVGATDSAVPCAQMINLATVMKDHLNSIRHESLSLMFIFFDGEEAFRQWSPKDSIYGARHLAALWHNKQTIIDEEYITELDKLDALLLLDLLGAPDPTFYNYFNKTERWYSVLFTTETKLANLRKLDSYSYEKTQQRYFQPYSVEPHIEDDHTPFHKRNVPIIHIIPYPFPPFWHEPGDNRGNIDLKTTENISKILRVFVASYLHISI